MDIRKIKADQLRPASYNPRKNLQKTDLEYQKIERSIKAFGYVDPIIVNSDMTIIGGHQRYKVLVDLGYTEIDCVVVDLPKDQEKALNIALNKISGEWDMPALKDLLAGLSDGMQELTGFDLAELDDLLKEPQEVGEDNFDPDEALANITEPVTKIGDIWQMGKHRLMCGDSTMINAVEKLMGGTRANLVVTDPPYNVDYVGKTKDALKIKNDNMDDNTFLQFLRDSLTNAYTVSEDGAPVYIFHADSEGLSFRQAMKEAGYKLAQCCIWVKQSMVMGRQDYQWQHEPILYGWKEGAAHKWHSDRKQTTVWNFSRPSRSEYHPTMKPIDLVSYPIKNSSLSNCVVLDLFGGSGSTLIACEQLNRICYMMELDDKYCDVIIKRWEQLTGQKAELIAG